MYVKVRMEVYRDGQCYYSGEKTFVAGDINEANLMLWEWESQVIPDPNNFTDSGGAIAFEWLEATELQTEVPKGYNGRSRVVSKEAISGEDWMEGVRNAYRDNGR